jgi:3-hydroxybutyryl-CoA dehydrogenase
MSIERVGVVGLGIMGAGIVEVFAKAGLPVVGLAESDDAVQVGKKNLATSLGRAVEREKITQAEADKVSARVTWGTDFALMSDCDLVVEAAPEIMKLKQSIFQQLDSQVKASGILATNTSSLSVADIARATNRPTHVIGMHFFNPAPVQKLVEVISHASTDATVTADVIALAKQLGKSPVSIGDQPGFIVNKLLLVYLNHAARIFDRGIAKENIDAAMRELAKFPMGPLELIDLVGLDTCYEILLTIAADTKNEAHQPAKSLVELVEAGNKGRKSGKGFYDYSAKHEPPTSADESTKQAVYEELMRAYLQSAIDMNNSGYANKDDIDLGMKLGCGLPEGPFETLKYFAL